jgi:hypothetical protein
VARYHPLRDVEPVLAAARTWIQTCLVDGQSLFWTRPLWTSRVIEEVRVAFTDNPDESEASFFEKLERQMAPASPDAKCLMAEILWALMLFQSNIGAAKKRESVLRIWNWSGRPLDRNHPMLRDDVLTGIGSPGTAYNTMRWREINYLIAIAGDLQARSEGDRASIVADRDRFEAWLRSAPSEGYRQFRHILRYFAFPDWNERITQNRDRVRILTRLGGKDERAVRALNDAQQDDALRMLREHLRVELGREVDFYEQDMQERWRDAKVAVVSPHKAAEVAEPTPDTRYGASPIPQQPPVQVPLNRILYGPPGTGKTYGAVRAALEVLDPELLARTRDRAAIKRRFDQLVEQGRVEFVTFHSSFSYEDFVEGIRPEPNGSSVVYRVDDGVFKRLCERARPRHVAGTGAVVDPNNRRIWKMSLGVAETDEDIYRDCIEQQCVMIGYCPGDVSRARSREDIREVFLQAGEPVSLGDYPVTAIDLFARQMQRGDLVVVSEGNLRVRAIAEVVGDYEYQPREGDTYAHRRKVRWLRRYDPSLPYDRLMENRFMQKTIYELRDGSINLAKLKELLQEADGDVADGLPHVLVIDEINRGSVSRIFGELITLIEKDKRAGMVEALQVCLPYSKKPFQVPANVYLIGTMNTADRSLSGLDIALRRRFSFVELAPDPKTLAGIEVDGLPVDELLRTMNERIAALLDREHRLGHAYFLPLGQDASFERLATIFEHQIMPLLQEYFFEDWERIRWVLNDHRKDADAHRFILPSKLGNAALFGDEVGSQLPTSRWVLNPDAFREPDSYFGILDQA